MYGDKPYSGRRIINLWKNLPFDSATSKIVDPQGAFGSRWTTNDHLLATVSEQLDAFMHTYVQSKSKNKVRWKALRHNRPELPDEFKTVKKRRNANAAEVKAILKGEL